MSVHPSVCPKPNFVESINVTNESCHICISDDKNVFGVITQPSGDTGHLWGPGQEDYPKVGQMKKKLLSSFNTPPVMLPCSYGWSFARMYPPSIYEVRKQSSNFNRLAYCQLQSPTAVAHCLPTGYLQYGNPNPKEPQGTLRNPSEH